MTPTPKSARGNKMEHEDLHFDVGARGEVKNRDIHSNRMRRRETDQELQKQGNCLVDSETSFVGEGERSTNLGENDEPSVGLITDPQVHSIKGAESILQGYKVALRIGDRDFIAFIDCGSNKNFMQPKVVELLKLQRGQREQAFEVISQHINEVYKRVKDDGEKF